MAKIARRQIACEVVCWTCIREYVGFTRIRTSGDSLVYKTRLSPPPQFNCHFKSIFRLLLRHTISMLLLIRPRRPSAHLLILTSRNTYLRAKVASIFLANRLKSPPGELSGTPPPHNHTEILLCQYRCSIVDTASPHSSYLHLRWDPW